MEIVNKLKNRQLIIASDTQQKRINFVEAILIIFAVGIIPISIFPRGGFQLADIFICLLIIYYFLKGSSLNNLVKKHIYRLIPFVCWVLIVVGGYYIYYGQFGILLIAINMIYALFMLYAFTTMWNDLISKQAYHYIYIFLLLSIICVFSFKGFKEWEGMRYSFSFNNPNQLGLFALIFQAIAMQLIILKKQYSINNKIYFLLDIFFIVLAHYWAFMAISRGTLAAFILLDICLLKNMLSKDMFLPVAGAIAVGGSLLLLLNPHFIQERIEARGAQRFNESSFWERLEIGIKNPMKDLQGVKIFFGTGQIPSALVFGRDRIRAHMGERGLEVHNMFGNVLWSYGIIGLILYASWVFKTIWEVRGIPNALWIWGALLTFSVSGVLIRSRMYWLILGLLIASWNIKISQKS